MISSVDTFCEDVRSSKTLKKLRLQNVHRWLPAVLVVGCGQGEHASSLVRPSRAPKVDAGHLVGSLDATSE